MKRLLKNAKIYDGTGTEAFIGDVLIEGERILGVGQGLQCAGAEESDLTGLSISSGFIDAHSHNDWFAIRQEPLKYFEPFIRQGITSFITGNCGLSCTGFEEDSAYIEKVGAGLFGFDKVSGRYGSVGAFFEAIDRKMPCNIATLVGHCSARTGVTGYGSRPLSPAEQEKMLAIMAKGLDEGACGLSLGLMYEPGLYAPKEELREVALLAERYNRPLTVHPRACSAVSMAYSSLFGRPHLLRALDELEEMGRGTQLKLQYSHAIFVGRNSFKCKSELVSIIHGMRRNGVDAMFDIYSETMGVSVITVVLPAWYQALSPKEKQAPLNKLKLDLLVKASSKLLGFGFADIQVAYIGPGYEQYEGKTVSQIAKEEGKSELDAYIDLCEKSHFKGRVNMGPYSTSAIVSDLSKDEHVLYMTDAWVEDHGVQNPAIYDCFPKFLKFSLVGSGDTMPRTIRKMTGATADRFGLRNRGYLKPGCFADLTIFNETILREAVPDQGRAFGIERVFINGEEVLNDGRLEQDALRKCGQAMLAA
ncbi:MAG: hypothetical protein VB108_08970 [Anaerolineaceae bacterium]|nr:hypothetical protein [Anaerolineaceae bacterium]